MWKWVIFYILMSDCQNYKLLSVDTFGEKWAAEVDLEFKMHGHSFVNFPGLPKDAIVQSWGATNNWEE